MFKGFEESEEFEVFEGFEESEEFEVFEGFEMSEVSKKQNYRNNVTLLSFETL